MRTDRAGWRASSWRWQWRWRWRWLWWRRLRWQRRRRRRRRWWWWLLHFFRSQRRRRAAVNSAVLFRLDGGGAARGATAVKPVAPPPSTPARRRRAAAGEPVTITPFEARGTTCGRGTTACYVIGSFQRAPPRRASTHRSSQSKRRTLRPPHVPRERGAWRPTRPRANGQSDSRCRAGRTRDVALVGLDLCMREHTRIV